MALVDSESDGAACLAAALGAVWSSSAYEIEWEVLKEALKLPRSRPVGTVWQPDVGAIGNDPNYPAPAYPPPVSLAECLSVETPEVIKCTSALKATLLMDVRKAFATGLCDGSLPWKVPRFKDCPDIVGKFCSDGGFASAMLIGQPEYGALFPSTKCYAGVVYMAPHLHYPAHAHDATETYLVLAGEAEWISGEQPAMRHPPGTFIHHDSGEPHAMRTFEEPLLLAYVWTGDISGRYWFCDEDDKALLRGTDCS